MGQQCSSCPAWVSRRLLREVEGSWFDAMVWLRRVGPDQKVGQRVCARMPDRLFGLRAQRLEVC